MGHLHAIVILDHPEPNDDVFGDVLMHGRVETHGRASLQTPQTTPPPQTFQRQPQSISSFVAGFKSATIKRIDDWIDENNLDMEKFNKKNPLWQSNYQDHIIRNETEYRYIEKYIADNPLKEDEDSL